jgi:hypothetical protein
VYRSFEKVLSLLDCIIWADLWSFAFTVSFVVLHIWI